MKDSIIAAARAYRQSDEFEHAENYGNLVIALRSSGHPVIVDGWLYDTHLDDGVRCLISHNLANIENLTPNDAGES
jgi:hypothetical protein